MLPKSLILVLVLLRRQITIQPWLCLLCFTKHSTVTWFLIIQHGLCPNPGAASFDIRRLLQLQPTNTSSFWGMGRVYSAQPTLSQDAFACFADEARTRRTVLKLKSGGTKMESFSSRRDQQRTNRDAAPDFGHSHRLLKVWMLQVFQAVFKAFLTIFRWFCQRKHDNIKLIHLLSCVNVYSSTDSYLWW